MRRLLSLLLSALTSCSLAQRNDPLSPLLKFAQRQPQDIAISTYALRPDGQPEPRRPRLDWNEAQPMPLASSMKIVILAAYAHAVVSGELNPQRPVTLADWEAFYLPGTDGGAHPSSLRSLKIPTDKYGRALHPNTTVTLDTLARFMIETSDNAATDYLLFQLGQNAIPDTIRRLGFTAQEDIGPIAGMFNAWDDPKQYPTYLHLTPAQRVADHWRRAQRLQANPALRDPNKLAKAFQSLSGEMQSKVQHQTTPHGSTQEYARLMAQVLSGTGFTAPELDIMRRHLSWPVRVNPQNQRIFSTLYAKGGSLSAGILTNNFAYQPKTGPAAGQSLVISIALRNIPQNEYARLQASMEVAMLMISSSPDFAQRLQDNLKK